MLLLAYGQGLRRGEIAPIHSSDLGRDLTGWTLVVHGKGGRLRRLPLWPETAERLRGRPSGWAFPGQSNGHLSAARVGEVLAGALPAGLAGHSLRHAFASRLWNATGDLYLVQMMLGHAHPHTTEQYILPAPAKLRDGLTRLSGPLPQP